MGGEWWEAQVRGGRGGGTGAPMTSLRAFQSNKARALKRKAGVHHCLAWCRLERRNGGGGGEARGVAAAAASASALFNRSEWRGRACCLGLLAERLIPCLPSCNKQELLA